jgi:UDP-N-acetylmuramoyl-tripeptide--D-alanyl-D-alanine ligase
VFGGVGPSVSASAFVALATPFFIALALVISAPAEDALAQRYVKRAKERIARVRPTIVGITGSFGKTSTKGYLEHLLAARFDVVASPRSFNNRAGLALAVNEHLLDGTDVFIAEMGAYGSGEIAALCAWLPPTVAVISAIGPVHLERFKTLDRILQAKVEILAHAEVAVLNVDDERLSLLAEELLTADRKVLRCSGNNLDADVIVRLDNAYLELIVDSAEVGRIACEGQRQTLVATNVACAVGAALALGCEPLELLERLGGLPVAKSRLEVSRANNGAMVLDDTFNANPAGVRRALSELASLGQPGKRRVVVTPGMVELGEKQLSENAEFAKRAAGVATDIVIVGKTNRRALRQGITTSSRELARARDASRSVQGLGETEPLHVLEVRTRDQAVAYVRDILGAGDVVLYENDLPDHYP